MRRVLSTIGTGMLVVLILALYREWIIRNKPPSYLPLGFFEQATQIVTAEEAAQNPASWKDSVASVVMDGSSFDSFARDSGANEMKTDILVVGATFGGVSAALAAAEDGARVVLTTELDWEKDILVEATMYAAEEIPPGPASSAMEQEMRAWRDALRNSRSGVIAPRAIMDHVVQRVKNMEGITIMPNVAIAAFGKDADKRINSALLRTPDGNNATALRFSYVIDGTRDGKILALAGVPTRTSWDTADAGAPDWPTALAEGYSMSGWTVAGIGRRLDGAHAHIGIVDRGYHGKFVEPTTAEDCWIRDETRAKKALIAMQPLLRSTSLGCAATMRIESSFEDTAEVFFINHGNEQLSATVTIGSGTTLRIEKNNLLQEQIVFIGAFPLSPRGGLTVDISSMLPGDRLEGLIVRKTNANASSIMLIPKNNASMTFSVNAWKTGSYDVYVTTNDAPYTNAAKLDGMPLDLEYVGPNTYAARGVPLSAGTHTFNALSNDEIRQIMVIPVQPHRETVEITPFEGPGKAQSWTLIPKQSGTYSLTAVPRSCRDACRFTLAESGSTTPPLLSGMFEAGSEVFSMSIPIGVARLQEGKSYILRSSDGFDATKTPSLALLEKSADIYAIARDKATIRPPVTGGIYDVWVRALRSDKVTLTIGKRTRTIESVNEWRYAGTEHLAANGATVSGKGTLEIIAMPNVQLDSYTVPLDPGTEAHSSDIPPGNYSIKSFGPQNPVTIGAQHDDGSTEVFSFQNDGDSYAADALYAKRDYPVTFSLTEPWPQRIVLFEDLGAHSTPITMSGGMLRTLLLNSGARPKSATDISTSSSGTLLFDPYPQGIGPVTIGTMESDNQDDRIKRIVDGAYLLLHLGRTRFTEAMMKDCGTRQDPICDVRRFTRAPDVLGTPDGITPTPYYPDTRRLEGLDILTASGAFALERDCDQCQSQCVDGSVIDGRCIAKNTATFPSDAIVSFPGVSRPISILSPTEESKRTLQVAFTALRKNRLLRSTPTYLEKNSPPRDVSLTLGMFFSAEAPNVLASNAAVSSTHGASRALRSQYAHMAIGNAIGHAAAFALLHERADIDFIAESTDALGRLQRHLAEKGITVMPLSEPDDDPLLARALQQRILEGKTSLTPLWTGERLTFVPTPISDDDVLLLSMMVFGGREARVLRDALLMLPSAPTDTDPTSLLRFGIDTGLITTKMLQLSLTEIMQFPLDESFLLKAAYIFHIGQ